MVKHREGPTMSSMDKKYQAENDSRTLIQAQEVRQSRNRFAAAKRELVSQAKAVKAAMKKS